MPYSLITFMLTISKWLSGLFITLFGSFQNHHSTELLLAGSWLDWMKHIRPKSLSLNPDRKQEVTCRKWQAALSHSWPAKQGIDPKKTSIASLKYQGVKTWFPVSSCCLACVQSQDKNLISFQALSCHITTQAIEWMPVAAQIFSLSQRCFDNSMGCFLRCNTQPQISGSKE